MSNLLELHLRGRAETNVSVDVYLVLVTIFTSFLVNVLSVLLNYPASGVLRNNTYPFGHTTPEKFQTENAALILRLGLPSTSISVTKNGTFQNRSSNRKNLETPVLRFSVDEKHFEKGAFRK